MPSTLNVDVAVNQSQIQSAISGIQQTLKQSSGDMIFGGGFGYAGGGGGMAGTGVTKRPYTPMRSPAVGLAQERLLSENAFRGAVERSLDNITSRGQMIQKKVMATGGAAFAPNALTKDQMATYKTTKATGQFFMEEGVMMAGSMIGGAILPGVGHLAGAVGGLLLKDKIPGISHAFKSMEDNYKRWSFGSDYIEPGSKKEANFVFKKLQQAQVGSAYSGIFGISERDFFNKEAFSNFAVTATGSIGKMLKNRTGLAASETFNIAKMLPYLDPSTTETYGEISKNLIKATNRFSGKVNTESKYYTLAKTKASQLSTKIKQINNLKNEFGLLNSDVMDVKTFTNRWTAPRMKRKSIWTKTGEAFGRKMMLGKRFGRGMFAKGSYTRSQAQTDLGMSSEDKKMLGGSRGVASQFMGDTMQSFADGGQYMGLLAIADSGQKMGSIFDYGAQTANALASPADQIHFMANTNSIKKKIGASGLVNMRRRVLLRQIGFAKQYGGLEGVSNKDILVAQFKKRGMNEVQAKAQAAMVLNMGSKVRYVGGGAYGKVRNRGVSKALAKGVGRVLGNVEGSELTNAPLYSRKVRKSLKGGAFVKMATEAKDLSGDEDYLKREGLINYANAHGGKMLVRSKDESEEDFQSRLAARGLNSIARRVAKKTGFDYNVTRFALKKFIQNPEFSLEGDVRSLADLGQALAQNDPNLKKIAKLKSFANSKNVSMGYVVNLLRKAHGPEGDAKDNAWVTLKSSNKFTDAEIKSKEYLDAANLWRRGRKKVDVSKETATDEIGKMSRIHTLLKNLSGEWGKYLTDKRKKQ